MKPEPIPRATTTRWGGLRVRLPRRFGPRAWPRPVATSVRLPIIAVAIACLQSLWPVFQARAAETPSKAAIAPEACTWVDGAIVRGPTQRGRIALVFTGHTFAESATPILDALAARRLPASFFLTGAFLANREFAPVVRRILREGHYLGPHSDQHLLYCPWDGPKTTLVSRDTFCRDLETNVARILALGAPRPKFFLPPFEHYNTEIASWTHDCGLVLVNFTPGTRSNADYTEEADKAFVSSDKILASILNRSTREPDGLNGFILLLHLGAGPGRKDKFHAKFESMLETLVGRGYDFVPLEELLSPAPDVARGNQAAGQVVIRASQAGYQPAEAKSAVILTKATPPRYASVIELDTGRCVYTGQVQALTGEHWGAFPHVGTLDFSTLRRGKHLVVEAEGTRSLPFAIGPGARRDLPDLLLGFMRQQRCGYNPWIGTNCHQLDGRTAFGPRPEGSELDSRGGWHDAGDLLKYQLTSGTATAHMLLAWQLTRSSAGSTHRGRVSPDPTLFQDRVNAAGDSGANKVPDVLDEARWGLEWLLRLHPSEMELYHQVADDRDHVGFRLPQHENADYGWGKGGARVVYAAEGVPQGLKQYKSDSTGLANLAGRYAAAMGLAAQIWGKDADPVRREFAIRCLRAGIEVYAMGRAKEGVQQGNSVRSPYRYEETTWADDMEWGAAELYRATREGRYLDDARRYAELAGTETWMGRDQTRHYQYYPYVNLGHFRLHSLVGGAFQRRLEGFYRDGIDKCVEAARGNPFGAGVPFIWCSANLTVALATQCRLYELMTGETRYRAFAARQRDWLLGRNPWGYTMYTGVGSVFPTDVHLQTTRLTGRSAKGGLVDGPVYERIFKSLRGVSISEPDPLAEFQDPRAVYHNDFQDYSTNEPIMDGTAASILLWALLSSG